MSATHFAILAEPSSLTVVSVPTIYWEGTI